MMTKGFRTTILDAWENHRAAYEAALSALAPDAEWDDETHKTEYLATPNNEDDIAEALARHYALAGLRSGVWDVFDPWETRVEAFFTAAAVTGMPQEQRDTLLKNARDAYWAEMRGDVEAHYADEDEEAA